MLHWVLHSQSWPWCLWMLSLQSSSFPKQNAQTLFNVSPNYSSSLSKVGGLYWNCRTQNIWYVSKINVHCFHKVVLLLMLVYRPLAASIFTTNYSCLTVIFYYYYYFINIILPFETLVCEDNFEFWSCSPTYIHSLPSSWSSEMLTNVVLISDIISEDIQCSKDTLN